MIVLNPHLNPHGVGYEKRLINSGFADVPNRSTPTVSIKKEQESGKPVFPALFSFLSLEISGFGFAADNITDPLRIMKDSSENNSGFHVHFPVSIR